MTAGEQAAELSILMNFNANFTKVLLICYQWAFFLLTMYCNITEKIN
jgi:hypothetical protein